LVSYCSPARAGTRELRLEVATTDEQGKKSIGRYDTEFDASGFGPGCNPLALPHFVVAKPSSDGRLASTGASGSKAATKPATPATKPSAPASDNDVKVSSAAAPAAKPSTSASAPIAEPPSGLGYE
jgi:hypothetical protein